MRIANKFICVLVLLIVIPFAGGQELQEQVKVELVQVDVVATDSKGAVVTDLTKEDFLLKENGKLQPVSHFYNSANDEIRYPLTISFVIDTSYSMHERVAGLTRIEIAVKAAELIVDQLKPDDQIELIEFNKKPDAIVPFTSDMDAVLQKIRTLDFRQESTAMHDAVLFAVNQIQERSGRKIIVVFSDGMDSSSHSIEEDVVDAVRKSDATIIAFYSEFSRLNFPEAGGPNTMGRIKIRTGEDLLREYSEITGGQFFSFRKEPELLKALDNFRAFVGSQYTLAYTPAAAKKKPEFRKIKVECKRKGITLRHRQGYWTG